MYIKNAKVFPLVKWTKWKPNSHMYRKVIGGSEVVCGAILSFIPGKYPSIIMFLNHLTKEMQIEWKRILISKSIYLSNSKYSCFQCYHMRIKAMYLIIS